MSLVSAAGFRKVSLVAEAPKGAAGKTAPRRATSDHRRGRPSAEHELRRFAPMSLAMAEPALTRRAAVPASRRRDAARGIALSAALHVGSRRRPDCRPAAAVRPAAAAGNADRRAAGDDRAGDPRDPAQSRTSRDRMPSRRCRMSSAPGAEAGAQARAAASLHPSRRPRRAPPPAAAPEPSRNRRRRSRSRRHRRRRSRRSPSRSRRSRSRSRSRPSQGKSPSRRAKWPRGRSRRPEARKPEEKKYDPRQFDALLKNLAPQAAAPSPDAPPQKPRTAGGTASSQPRAPLGGQLTASELDMVRQQIARCWNVPAGARDAKDLVVEIRVVVDPDGTVRQATIVDQGRLAATLLPRRRRKRAARLLQPAMPAAALARREIRDLERSRRRLQPEGHLMR